MDEKLFVGLRTGFGCSVFVNKGGIAQRLHHVIRHSPTGFEWGYGGSGPADLALSLLADVAGLSVADRLYQAFKAEVVAKLDHAYWKLHEQEILGWLKRNVKQNSPVQAGEKK